MKGRRVDESGNDCRMRNDPSSAWHAASDRIFIGWLVLFFLTSPPPSIRTRARDERAVKTASSYMQTALHYATEMCIFSRQFAGWIHPFDGCRTVTRKHRNQRGLVTSRCAEIRGESRLPFGKPACPCRQSIPPILCSNT